MALIHSACACALCPVADMSQNVAATAATAKRAKCFIMCRLLSSNTPPQRRPGARPERIASVELKDNLRMVDEEAAMLSAAEIIRLLDLKPHPEGGHFRETFRDPRQVDGARAASTVAYYLLARGERSHWHKVDAVEAWLYHAGAPLKLEIAADAKGPV